MYRFQCDYTEGAHPAIMQRMVETNMEQTDGYGLDPYCDSARQKIKDLCECQDADVRNTDQYNCDQCGTPSLSGCSCSSKRTH